MNYEDKGRYISLLCLQHQIYPERIPENHMISVCLSLDNQAAKKFIKDENGFYYNERMEQEIKKRISFCESRSNNKSGRPEKKSYDSTYDKSHDNHMLLHMENENDNDNKEEKEIEEIYLMYPTTDKNRDNQSTGKTSKNKQRIKKILESKYPLKKAIEFYLSECNRTKCYLKNFGTFLNNLPDVELLEDKKEETEQTLPQVTQEQLDIMDEIFGRKK